MRFYQNFFLATFLLSSTAYSNSCPNEKNYKAVDLRSEFGPIRNQDSVGWCYAFTAADLLTHYMYKNPQLLNDNKKGTDFLKRENMISATGVATDFNEKNFPKYYEEIKNLSLKEVKLKNVKILSETLDQSKIISVIPESGYINRAIEYALEGGLCSEAVSPSESFDLVLGKLCAVKKICSSDLRGVFEGIYDSVGPEGLKEEQNCSLLEVVKAAYPTIPEKNLKQIIANTSRDKVFYELNRFACYSNYTSYLKKKPEVLNIAPGFFSNENLFEAMDKALLSGGAVGISYDGDSLLLEESKFKVNHASTIVGKRINPKTCKEEYIIRNSYGPECLTYYQNNPNQLSCELTKKNDDVWFHYGAIAPLESQIKRAQIEYDQDRTQEHFKKLTELKEELKNVKEPRYRDFITSALCAKENPPVPRNPQVSCDFESGYLYVTKEHLKKSLGRVTIIK